MEDAIKTGSAEEGKVPQVTIYTSNDCHWCEVAKRHFAQHGVSYIEKNVEHDDAAGAEAMQLSGQRRTPVIVVGSQVIVGFQRRELERGLSMILGLDPPNVAAE